MDKQLQVRVVFDAVLEKASRGLKGLKGQARDTAMSLKATRDRLNELNKVQADLQAFKKLRADAKAAGGAMAEAQKRAADLAAKVAAVEEPSKKLNAEMARAKARVESLKAAEGARAQKLRELRTSLSAAGVETRKLAQHEAQLKTEVAGVNTEISKQKQRLKELGAIQAKRREAAAGTRRMSGFQRDVAGAGAGGLAAGVAAGAPLLAQVNGYDQVESSMTTIGQKADLTRKQNKALLDQLIATAPIVNQELTGLIEGVDTLTGFGLGPKVATDMMRPIGKAATAYKAEIADLSAAAFAAGDNLKVPFKDTGLVIDTMAKAGKLGAVEIKDMAAGFPALTAQAQALGQKGAPAVAELAAALQVVRKGAGSSEAAITNLENLQQKILSPETIRKFGKAGIDLEKAMKRAKAAGKSPLEAIAEITKTATKGDLSKLGFFFEDAQAQAALRSLIQNMDEFKRIRGEALAAGGTTDRDFAKRQQDNAERSRNAAIAVQTLGLTIGATLSPAVVAVKEQVGRLASGITAWVKQHPVLARWIIIIVGAIVALVVALSGLALIVAGVMGPFIALRMAMLFMMPMFAPMVAGIVSTTTALGGMAVALLANPITWIILAIVAAIALLAGGVYLLVKHWGKIVPWFAGVWKWMKEAAAAGLQAIVGFIMNFTPLGAFIRAFAPIWTFCKGLFGRFLNIGSMVMQGLIDGFKAKFAALKNTIKAIAQGAIGWFKNLLGIKSPSRVFMGLGQHTMGGLAVGLQRGEREPLARIRDTAGKLTAAMAIGAGAATIPMAGAASTAPGSTAAGVPAAAAQAAGDHYEVHFHAAPGMEPKELMRLFEEWMRKREADKRRSTLHDSGE